MRKPGVIQVIIITLGIIDVCNAQACLSWTSSENEELLQQYRRESIRRQILRKLDLTQPPNNPDPTFVGQDIAEVLAEYEAIAHASELVGSVGGSCTEYNHYAHDVLVFFPTEVNTTRSQQHVSDLNNTVDINPVDRYRLKFELDLSGRSFITGAELRLYKERITSLVDTEESVRVEVYVITYPRLDYYGEVLPQFVSATYVSLDREGFITFNMTSAIEGWLTRYSSVGSIELSVRIRYPEAIDGETQFLPSIGFAVENNRTTPQFIVNTYEHESSRQRRQSPSSQISTPYCLSHPNERRCCLRSLEINFRRDFNWSWIIEPQSFFANYCEGLCPRYWGHSGEHSWFLSIYLESNPTAAAEPCCVPDRFIPLPLLALYDSKPVMYSLDDVRVDSCICR